MTDQNTISIPNFEIKERVVQTGYVNKDGKFVPSDGSETPVATVQTGEDVVAD